MSDLNPLIKARADAIQLFGRIEQAEVVRAGRTETEINDDIFELARAEFWVTKHWHKRIARAGVNSRMAYRANPLVRILDEDEMVYVYPGPAFEANCPDFGRTHVLGQDADNL